MNRRIFVYNPTCEMAVANGLAGYCPPRNLLVFERDLAPLLAFAAVPSDCVVAPPLDDALAAFLQQIGLDLPQFITADDARQRLASHSYNFQPWGRSKSIFHSFGVEQPFEQEHRLLFSRLSSVDIEHFCTSDDDFFVNADAQVVRSMEDFERACKIFDNNFVVKSLWSSSGRGVAKSDNFISAEYFTRWAEARLKSDDAFVVEPLLQKVSDIAFLYYINDDATVSYLGYNVFSSDAAGRFGRELIGAHHPSLDIIINDRLTQVVDLHRKALINSNINKKYSGYLGFDSMLFLDENGEMRFRPCVECNLRMTMGNVNMGVRQLFAPGVKAWWQIGSYGADNEWNNFVEEESRRSPLTLRDGKIERGFFRLTPLGSEKRFGAFGYAGDV